MPWRRNQLWHALIGLFFSIKRESWYHWCVVWYTCQINWNLKQASVWKPQCQQYYFYYDSRHMFLQCSENLLLETRMPPTPFPSGIEFNCVWDSRMCLIYLRRDAMSIWIAVSDCHPRTQSSCCCKLYRSHLNMRSRYGCNKRCGCQDDK